MLSTSAAGIESHTPSTSNIPGRISMGIIRNTSVRNSERIAEVFPSLSAVKKPEAKRLKPISKNDGARLIMATTKAKKVYTEIKYKSDDFLVFGKESAGIPEEILLDYKDTSVRIPMAGSLRSLNLSNSVAIAVYEVLRQWDFPELLTKGKLTKYDW